LSDNSFTVVEYTHAHTHTHTKEKKETLTNKETNNKERKKNINKVFCVVKRRTLDDDCKIQKKRHNRSIKEKEKERQRAVHSMNELVQAHAADIDTHTILFFAQKQENREDTHKYKLRDIEG